MSIPGFTLPSLIRQKTITPLYESYKLSKIKAFKGSFSSPSGDGIFLTIASSTSLQFSPVLAEISGASDASIPITSSISAFTLSGSADGKSILFITGKTSRS